MPEGLDGLRLDAALSRLFGLSRTTAVTIIESGGASLDGRVRGKSDRVLAGSVLEVDLPSAAPTTFAVPEVVEGLRVVHEDDSIIVVDKPVGVAAHPSGSWEGPTVIGGLVAAGHRVSTSGAEERQGVVHRLDVGTSGLMVVAKSEHAYSVLKDAFRERTVDKRYHTLVQGHPDPTSGTIDAPIGRHPQHDYKWAVTAEGKPSVTHYDLIEAFRAASLLDVKLETGRTHQIRVHLAAIGHPLVGDPTYGDRRTTFGLGRPFLHAAELSFVHPTTGDRLTFTSPLPADLSSLLATLEPSHPRV